MIRRIAFMLAIGIAGTAPAATAGMANVRTLNDSNAGFTDRILALHNLERAAVGTPPLAWDPLLAQSAASYGPTLAALGRLQHSPRDTRPGQRENLAMGPSGLYDDRYLAGMWIAEKRLFTPGLFPNVSRAGRWEEVAHYTQMVWRGTTHVGCALHRGGGNDFLICRYSPPGNKDGKPVF